MADALQLLRDDHKRVKDLFSRFEAEDDARAKGEIARKALTELAIHADIEEKVFYPALRAEADAEEHLMDEADEEHHVAKLLMAELRRMKPNGGRFDAKFTVLAENVKHHIDEEESEMLPKAAELGMARMNELGAEMERRKTGLQDGMNRRARSTHRPAGRTAARPRSGAGATRARSTASVATPGKRSSSTRAGSKGRSARPPARRGAASSSATAGARRTAPRTPRG